MPNVIPCLRYDDLRAAIDWLGAAFGFAPTLITTRPDGTPGHTELTLDGGMVMLGPAGDAGLPGTLTARAAGGVTQTIYVVLDEVDAHHARAVAAGAEVVRALDDTPYGSREYTVRDPEGNVWSFGTYRPAT